MSKEIDTLLVERGQTHGDYADHAGVTQQVKAVFHNHPGWARLNDMQRETLDMIAHKAGRVLAGNPNFPDHWDDIAGYARLVSQRIEPILHIHRPKTIDEKVADALGVIPEGNKEEDIL